VGDVLACPIGCGDDHLTLLGRDLAPVEVDPDQIGVGLRLGLGLVAGPGGPLGRGGLAGRCRFPGRFRLDGFLVDHLLVHLLVAHSGAPAVTGIVVRLGLGDTFASNSSGNRVSAEWIAV